jgi:hypothetical protein
MMVADSFSNDGTLRAFKMLKWRTLHLQTAYVFGSEWREINIEILFKHI